MPTYYTFYGFVVNIYREPGSQLSGKIYQDGSLYHTIVPGSSFISLYLNTDGEYTFDLENTSATDPLKFEILDYETGDLITEITFPLETPLTLIVGIDGEASTDLSINYPLKSFTFANPTKLKVIWYCIPLSLNCEQGLEITAEDLPEPKIIGNLSGCSRESYKGDLTQDVVCDNEVSGQYYLFSIYNNETLLYSRLECCCPTVVPEDNPEVGFVCTCPDWGKATSYNQTLFSSSVRLRQWVQSGAGSKADCKHIMAAKRIMGIEQPTYTDPPYSAPPPPATPG